MSLPRLICDGVASQVGYPAEPDPITLGLFLKRLLFLLSNAEAAAAVLGVDIHHPAILKASATRVVKPKVEAAAPKPPVVEAEPQEAPAPAASALEVVPEAKPVLEAVADHVHKISQLPEVTQACEEGGKEGMAPGNALATSSSHKVGDYLLMKGSFAWQQQGWSAEGVLRCRI